MFQISDNAGKLIRKMTQKNGFPGGGLRIGIKAGGCSGLSYVFAWEPAPKDGDHVFDGPEGSRVFVDQKSYKFIEGTTLDYDTSLVSKGFTFDNPNAKGTCGCGTSFSV
jgi:iron-sulfur cluster assembly protein